jgi:hypothetical protein
VLLTSALKDFIQHATVIYTLSAARLDRQHWLDGRFIVSELTAHDSGLLTDEQLDRYQAYAAE